MVIKKMDNMLIGVSLGFIVTHLILFVMYF